MLRVMQGKLAASPLFRTPERVAGVVVLVSVLLQLVAVALYNKADRSILDLGFSFDPYVKSLFDGKGYVGCEDFGCHYSSRMPGLPYFVYALGFLTLKYKVAAYLKVLLLGLCTWLAARVLAREITLPTPLAFAFSLLVVGFLVFAPNLTKHMSVLHYEEGYLVGIIAVLVMLTLALLLRGPGRFSAGIAAAAVGVAALSYLIKSSQVVVLFAVVVITVWLALAAGRRAVAAGLVALALIAPAGWTAHNLATGNRLSFMSSYDGENFFRGFSQHTLTVYPECGLDVLFTPMDLCQGKKLNLPHEISRFGYKNEWDWNDAYKARAMAFIKENPGLALKTFAVKFLTVTAWPRLVPYVLEDETGKERWRKPAEEIGGAAWLTLGRLIEFFGLGLAVMLLIRGDGRARAIAASGLFLAASYAAPYIMGFGVERHFSIFIMICALVTLVLVTEWQRLKVRQNL